MCLLPLRDAGQASGASAEPAVDGTAEPGNAAEPDSATGPGNGPEVPGSDEQPGQLTGGAIPEHVLAGMLAGLRAESEPALPAGLHGITAGRGRLGLAIGGGLAMVTIALLLLALGGLFL